MTKLSQQDGDLRNLRGIVPAEPVPFWPPAPGVWVILGLLVLALLSVAWLLWKRWRRNAYRRAGLALLDGIERRMRSEETRAAALRELPVLLKRVALAAFPRREVAGLSGPAWLDFLDRTGGNGAFRGASGRLIAELSCVPSLRVEPAEASRLVALVRSWIRAHRPTANREE